jgi:uncharacterized protein (TIGR04255 family)
VTEQPLGNAWSQSLPPPIRSRHYQNAPIIEAIIDIRCQGAESLDLDQVALNDPDFLPPERALNVIQSLNITPEGLQSEATGIPNGLIYRRADRSRVMQVRRDGFGYSWIGAYESWEPFRDETERWWLWYREIAKPARSIRLGVRYINRLDIPQTSVELKDYIRVGVDLPAYLPQMIGNYFVRVDVPLPDLGCSAAITSLMVQPSNPDTTSVILDIDAHEESVIDFIEGKPSTQVADRLEVLRTAKNYVFEACITDATRGLIS